MNLLDVLGDGQDGWVWGTSNKSALKIFERSDNYCRERDCYQRLAFHDVSEIRGCTVPRLVRFDDELLAVEMGVVRPPCILDFGKAYLDRKPDYDAETLAEEQQARQEIWGRYFKRVELIVAALERYGIYYVDSNPRNIRFVDWDGGDI